MPRPGALALPAAGDAPGVLLGRRELQGDTGAPVPGLSSRAMETEEGQESVLLRALKSSPLPPLGFPSGIRQDSRSAWLIRSY